MTFTKISVLVPTRGRVARLRTLITSFDQTTGNAPNAELVFRVDDDDPLSYHFLLGWDGHKIVAGPRFGGYVSMPTFFNEMAKAADGDVLMCGNDDMIFKTPGWPALVLAEANKYPDGMFDIGVKTHNEDHYPFSIVSRTMVDRLGFIWDPRIFWGDIFLRDVMAAFGRCVMLPSVQVDHDWVGLDPDQVFLESPKDVSQIDSTYWSGAHATAVSEAVKKLQEQKHD